jgi:alkanesulfonate monooxygenase SsuD/methylene tetrahydromethanopterin reductase-like flavin-dependent oxidoreductase (luciferase family)
MRALEDDLKSRMDDLGRNPDDAKILWGAQPLVAPTEQEARARNREIRARIPLDAKLALVGGHFNVDLSQYDIDTPVSRLDLNVQGTRGMLESYTRSNPDITLREIADSYLSGSDDSPMVGTPEQVADYMIHLLEEGGGTGFQITPSYYAPHYYADLVEHLIPVLQKRGVLRTEYHGNTLRDYMNSW